MHSFEQNRKMMKHVQEFTNILPTIFGLSLNPTAIQPSALPDTENSTLLPDLLNVTKYLQSVLSWQPDGTREQPMVLPQRLVSIRYNETARKQNSFDLKQK